MAQPYVTGPCHIAVAFGLRATNRFGTPLYLGTAERSPRIQIRPTWTPLFNDIGGSQIPFDMAYEGDEAFISADLTRWNEGIYALLAARTNNPANQLGRGTNINGDLGTLMITENVANILLLQFPYSTLKAATYGTQPAGYRFLRTWLEGPDDLDPLGTQPRKIRLVFRALRAFSITSNGPNFGLYDHNMVAFPNIN